MDRTNSFSMEEWLFFCGNVKGCASKVLKVFRRCIQVTHVRIGEIIDIWLMVREHRYMKFLQAKYTISMKIIPIDHLNMIQAPFSPSIDIHLNPICTSQKPFSNPSFFPSSLSLATQAHEFIESVSPFSLEMSGRATISAASVWQLTTLYCNVGLTLLWGNFLVCLYWII